MSNRLDEFRRYRTRRNDRISRIDHLGIQRFFNPGNSLKDLLQIRP
jgi:hypothetical protein